MEELDRLRVSPDYSPENIREQHFQRLAGEVYLDHTGAALYGSGQLLSITEELSTTVLGNPHSRHRPSDTASQILHSARQRVLRHFNTTDEEYSVVFTSGATAAIKIVAENFKWGGDLTTTTDEDRDAFHPGRGPGCYVYTRENHTSVLGIRACASRAGASVVSLASEVVAEIVSHEDSRHQETSEELESLTNDLKSTTLVENEPEKVIGKTSEIEEQEVDNLLSNALFAYSAQCNYSGAKYPLDWVQKVQAGVLDQFLNDADAAKPKSRRRRRWFVLLDAASLVASSPLDLSAWRPDFVPVSFYKMFGYPTGLGCLLVHRRAWDVLDKSYFGGGTVELADSRSMHTVLRSGPQHRFEDGTVSFLGVAALRHGFDSLARLCGSMSSICRHVYHLSRYLHHSLASYRHANGAPVAQLYGPPDSWSQSTRGPIVNFNLFTDTGDCVGYTHVEQVASIYNIHVRTGCVCNPGACQQYLGISSEELQHQHKAGHVCGDTRDLVDGRPTGSVRVSFGYSSTYGDADTLLRMVRESFVSGALTVDTRWMKDTRVLPGESKVLESAVGMDKPPGRTKEDETQEGSVVVTRNEILEDDKDKVGCDEPLAKGKNITTTFSTQLGGDYVNGFSVENHFGVNGNENEMIRKTEETNHCEATLANDRNDNNSHEFPQSLVLTDRNGNDSSDTLQPLILTAIKVYPVKSCGAMAVRAWPLCSSGLLFDRHWMIVNSAGYILTLKRQPLMSLITPSIDLQKQLLTLSYPEYGSISVPLDGSPEEAGEGLLQMGLPCSVRLCGDQVRASDCGQAVADWLTEVLGTSSLRLLRQEERRKGNPTGGIGSMQSTLSLANEAPLLLLHRPSVRCLATEVLNSGRDTTDHSEEDLLERFRGNLILDGGEEFEEDQWEALTSSQHRLQVEGPCERCQMVSVSPDTGARTLEPLLSLKTIRQGARVTFGVLASLGRPLEDQVLDQRSEVDQNCQIKQLKQEGSEQQRVIVIGTKFTKSMKISVNDVSL